MDRGDVITTAYYDVVFLTLPLVGVSPSRNGAVSDATLTHVGQSVGIRELQQHASRVVADAVAHGPITITQRGRAVAMVVPLAGSGLDDLRAQGLVTSARRPWADLPPPVLTETTLTETLERMREDERY